METLNIETYDNLLLMVAEDIYLLTSRIKEAYDKRPSVLGAYAVVGRVAAEIYVAIGMAWKYREQKLWLTDESRHDIDEWNYGMLLHIVGDGGVLNRTIMHARGLLSISNPDEHNVADMAACEMVFIGKCLELCDDDFFGMLKNSVMELGAVLADIFRLSHPEFRKGDKVQGRMPQDMFQYAVFTSANELIVQQACDLSEFDRLVSYAQKTCRAWPVIEAEVMHMACDMEKTIQSLDEDVADKEHLEEAADYLDDMSLALDCLDMLADEYHQIATTPEDEDIVTAVEQSAFPLIARTEAAVKVTAPYKFMFPKMVQTYKVMCQEFKMKVTNLLRQAE